MALALALLAAGAAPAAEDAAPATLASVQQCVAANAPARTMRQRVELSTYDRMGESRVYDVSGDWMQDEDGHSKLLLRVSAPADLRGSAFLMIERAGRDPDLFSYLPELDKVRRINVQSASGSLFGSDFSYEDVRRMQNVARAASSVLAGEEEREGRPAWRIETTPAPEEASEYTRIVSWVDRERCVPLRVEFTAGGPEPAKVLVAPPAQVAREGRGFLPMEVALEDRREGTRSVLRVVDVELDAKLSQKHFTQSALRRRR